MTEALAMQGKTVAITGASSGIGQTIAATLGKAGAHVFMCGRTTEAMAATKSQIEASGGGASLHAFDIRDTAELQMFIKAASRHGDGLDLLVNNAGLGHQEPIADADPESWREMLDVNVLALLVGSQAAIQAMRVSGRPGRIINISSTASINRTSGVYGATKHAVNVITATLREELQDDDIRVTSLMPGVFKSNFARNFDPAVVNGLAEMLGFSDFAFEKGQKLPPELMDKAQAAMSRQMGDPQALADAVLYIMRQPIDIGIDEIVVRPPKNLDI
jgi:NADP-dependent 3-hydroxy acid dehydrogenase YdfG